MLSLVVFFQSVDSIVLMNEAHDENNNVVVTMNKNVIVEFDMKFLSCILALWVMLLSTLPCFLEDKCLFQHTDDMQEDTCPNNNGTSCTDCCSPFLHCSTCTGFLIPKLIHSPFIRMVLLNDNLHSFYKERLIPQFSSAIWQPPKLINT